MAVMFLTFPVAQLDLITAEDDEGIGDSDVSQSLTTDDVDPCDNDGSSRPKVGFELHRAVYVA